MPYLICMTVCISLPPYNPISTPKIFKNHATTTPYKPHLNSYSWISEETVYRINHYLKAYIYTRTKGNTFPFPK